MGAFRGVVLLVVALGCGRTALERDAGACLSCEQLGAQCGAVDDGCGHPLDCGICEAGLICGGENVPNRCGPFCTDGWCWQRPLPQGNGLRAAWRSEFGHLFVVGSAGTVMKWDGAQWSRIPFSPDFDLIAIWGSSETDLWVSAIPHAAWPGPNLWHFDGVHWSSQTLPMWPLALGGTARDDVWAPTGTAMWHFDGARWSQVAELSFGGIGTVRAFSRREVWVASWSGVFHFDGDKWSASPLTGTQLLEDIDGTGPNDLWAVGGLADSHGKVTGLVEHWDGVRWTLVTTPGWPMIEAADWSAVWVAGPDDVWVAGAGDVIHFDGNRWDNVPTGTNATLRRFSGGDPLYVLGEGGTVLQWSQGAWRSLEGGQGSLLSGIWGSSPDDVWTAGWDGYASHFDGTRWTPAIGLDEPRHDLGVPGVPPGLGHAALFGSGRDDVWAISWPGQPGGPDSQLQHFDSIGWSQAPITASQSPLRLVTGCASTALDAWAAGNAVVHWDGLRWKEVTVPGLGSIGFSFRGAACLQPGQAWFSGSSADSTEARVYRWDGTVLAPVLSVPGEFEGIWAAGPQDVWVVGNRDAVGLILHFDGRAWSEIDWRPAVAGRDPNEALAQFTSVSGGAGNVWVSTDYGFLLRFDGHQWVREETGARVGAMKLWRAADGSRWVAGANDAILHHAP